MLQQHILSLLIRMIPEAFLIMYAIYRLTNSKINFISILISSVLGGVGVYLARLLPVHFGVHTILAVMLYIILAVKLNKIEVYKSIATTLISLIFLFISDLTLVFIYTKVFQFSSAVVFGQTWVATIAGIPSLIVFYLLILLIIHIKEKRG